MGRKKVKKRKRGVALQYPVPTKEGERCRHCDTPVVKRQHSNKRPIDWKKTYHHEYWLFCPGCKAVYTSEATKVEHENGVRGQWLSVPERENLGAFDFMQQKD